MGRRGHFHGFDSGGGFPLKVSILEVVVGFDAENSTLSYKILFKILEVLGVS